MSFRPAGDEDSDSDDDGFYLGSNYSVKTDRDTVNNGINANKSVSPPETFTAMPAGAELDEVYNEDFERSTTPKISVPSTSSPIDGRKAQKKANKTSDGISSSRQTSGVSGPGRGQIQPRGRGRGGFPKPPPSSGNRGKSTRRYMYAWSWSIHVPKKPIPPRFPWECKFIIWMKWMNEVNKF